MNTIAMSAGKYYIGDLCYVMSNEWNEFCDLTIDGHDVLDGKFALKDGREFITFSTAYGDGVYGDNFGREYGVDAGLIGAIKVEDIRQELPDDAVIVEFASDWSAASDGGVLCFGSVEIDTTGSAYDDDEDDYGYDEDEENE